MSQRTLVFFFALAASGWACASSSSPSSNAGSGTTGTTSDAGASANADASPGDSSRAAWSYGNADDETAYCDLYAKAEAMVDCEASSELETSRLASCTKLMPCYRSVYEPDFLERQRTCLEEKLACSRSDTDACDELAGKTYSAGASLAATCQQRKTSCKQAGSKLDVGCDSLAALTADARKKTVTCLDPGTACADIVPCMLSSFGGACANP